MSLANLQGICRIIFMDGIHLEDDSKLAREMQHKSNPHIKEGLQREEVNLLDFGIIYPIFDSQWVSPSKIVQILDP